jgi:CheY-like chemotaxis protein
MRTGTRCHEGDATASSVASDLPARSDLGASRNRSSAGTPSLRCMARSLDLRWHLYGEQAPFRVLVGEYHSLVREGFVRVLEMGGCEVIGAVGDAEDLVQSAQALHPDVVVTDIKMLPTSQDDGLQAAKTIRAANPEIGVLVFSQILEARYVLDLLSEGAQGSGTCSKTEQATSL